MTLPLQSIPSSLQDQQNGLWPTIPPVSDLTPSSGTKRITLPFNQLNSESAQVTAFPQYENNFQFKGSLFIPAYSFTLPEQNFIGSFALHKTLLIENLPENSEPKIAISLQADSSDIFRLSQFHVRPSVNTVTGEIKYTRLQTLLARGRTCSLNPLGLNFDFEPLKDLDMAQLTHRAKLFRKLGFIEQKFGRLSIPEIITPKEVNLIDLIFRGITEGEFSRRDQEITLLISPLASDLTKPPFYGFGAFPQPPEVWHFVDNHADLFGRTLEIGPVLVKLEYAELASPLPSKLDNHDPTPVRFDLPDHQYYCRFENYACKSKQELQRRLDQFRYELASEEPEELANLLLAPLIRDVSSDEAIQIAVGWLYYHRVPDRFCPQDPQLDTAASIWRIPIFLVFADHNRGPVGQLIIDVKSGKIIEHTPLDEITEAGSAMVGSFPHVPETTSLQAGD